MPMKNPPHPGGFVLRQCIEPLGLSITDAAAALDVTRTTLSELVNEKRGISPEMAVRLSKVSAAALKAGLCNRRSMTLPKFAPTASSSNGLNWLDHVSKRVLFETGGETCRAGFNPLSRQAESGIIERIAKEGGV